jgi:hypothetical protein
VLLCIKSAPNQHARQWGQSQNGRTVATGQHRAHDRTPRTYITHLNQRRLVCNGAIVYLILSTTQNAAKRAEYCRQKHNKVMLPHQLLLILASAQPCCQLSRQAKGASCSCLCPRSGRPILTTRPSSNVHVWTCPVDRAL